MTRLTKAGLDAGTDTFMESAKRSWPKLFRFDSLVSLLRAAFRSGFRVGFMAAGGTVLDEANDLPDDESASYASLPDVRRQAVPKKGKLTQ